MFEIFTQEEIENGIFSDGTKRRIKRIIFNPDKVEKLKGNLTKFYKCFIPNNIPNSNSNRNKDVAAVGCTYWAR